MTMFGKKKKIKNLEGLPEEAKKQIEEGPQSDGVSDGGLNGQNLPEAVPFHDQSPSEIVYKNSNNAWIVLGRDRPGPKNSGYGGQGATQAGSIDLVAGKMGSTKDGPKSNIYVDPNFASDSARIYISQKTDIDKNFGLVKGNVGLSVARSGIGIKADAVRVIGREGIKLVTGTSPQELNSAGEKVTTTYGIDLIAGNDDQTLELEPIVKGLRLAEALKDMNARIDELNGLYTTLVLALIAHSHPPFMVPSPQFAVMGLAGCVVPAYGHKVKVMADQINNYQPFGSNWICSRHNRVN
tara:strand:- start:332 stop:1219 length:888 start_codon:yes stop_codon:yes gene_type:complete